MTEQTAEKTMAAQSELIRALQEEIKSLKIENKQLRHDLYDAEAIIVCNRIVRPAGAKKVFCVPRNAR